MFSALFFWIKTEIKPEHVALCRHPTLARPSAAATGNTSFRLLFSNTQILPRSQSATLPPFGPCTAATKTSAPKQRLSAVWGPGPSPDSEAGPAGFQEKVPCCFDFSKSAQGRPQGVSPIQLLLRGDLGSEIRGDLGGRFRTRAPIHALAPRHRKLLPDSSKCRRAAVGGWTSAA